MDQLKELQDLISRGEVTSALEQLDRMIQEDPTNKDELYYIRGNAFRKKGDWQQALNNYQSAIDINPQSPAVQARAIIIDILNFYHKDMFNH
ncbi:MAG: tetratricopeptide repeat protein [Bacteroides sp.]